MKARIAPMAAGRGNNTKVSQKGLSYLTLLVFGTLFFGIGYYISHVAPIMYGYWELDNHMQTIIRLADQLTDDEIRKRLKITIKEQEIPLAVDKIVIFREKNHMIISAKYKKTFKVVIRGKEYWKQDFKFKLYAEGDF